MNNIDQRKDGKVMTQFMVHVIMVMQIFFLLILQNETPR